MEETRITATSARTSPVDAANVVCRAAVGHYFRDKRPDDPIASQVVANAAVVEAADGLAVLAAAELEPLEDALRAYASSGRELAIAMDKYVVTDWSKYFDPHERDGGQVKREAKAIGSSECAELGDI
jgi:hypothetical protein